MKFALVAVYVLAHGTDAHAGCPGPEVDEFTGETRHLVDAKFVIKGDVKESKVELERSNQITQATFTFYIHGKQEWGLSTGTPVTVLLEDAGTFELPVAGDVIPEFQVYENGVFSIYRLRMELSQVNLNKLAQHKLGGIRVDLDAHSIGGVVHWGGKNVQKAAQCVLTRAGS